MHDWTLITIFIDWEMSKITITFSWRAVVVELIAEDFSLVNIPQKKEWGASVSVNELMPLKKLDDGNLQVEIEVQTGDIITIVAKKFIFPEQTIF